VIARLSARGPAVVVLHPIGRGGRCSPADLRVMSPLRGVVYLQICRAFVKLRSVTKGQICLSWYPFGTRFRACSRHRGRGRDPRSLTSRAGAIDRGR
jgi:hypothetical protein